MKYIFYQTDRDDFHSCFLFCQTFRCNLCSTQAQNADKNFTAYSERKQKIKYAETRELK